MVDGELDRFPLELQTKIKMICFWYKLVSTYPEMILHLLICIAKMAATQLSAFFI